MDEQYVALPNFRNISQKIEFILKHNFDPYSPPMVFHTIKNLIASSQEGEEKISIKTSLLCNITIWNNLRPKDLYSLINQFRDSKSTELKEKILIFLKMNPKIYALYTLQGKHHQENHLPVLLAKSVPSVHDRKEILEKNLKIEDLEKQISKLKKQLSYFAPFLFERKSPLFDI